MFPLLVFLFQMDPGQTKTLKMIASINVRLITPRIKKRIAHVSLKMKKDIRVQVSTINVNTTLVIANLKLCDKAAKLPTFFSNSVLSENNMDSPCFSKHGSKCQGKCNRNGDCFDLKINVWTLK